MSEESELPLVRFVLKFAEGQAARLENGEFRSAAGVTFSPLNEWLTHNPPREIFPLVDAPPGSGLEASASERDLGLDRFFYVVIETSKEEIEHRLDELNRLPFLEEVYVEEPAEPA